MKKLLFFLFTISSFSIASAQDFIQNHLYYSIVSGTNNEVSIQGSINVSGNLIIPSTVTNNGITYFVTSIGDYVFQNSYNLTSVSIPNTVTFIGNYTFDGCAGLTSIIIPNSVTSIGNSAFKNCNNLTSITIPNSVISIGNSAFRNCNNLTSVLISDSVTSIGESAFLYCSSLTSITIPNSVTSIGESAFTYCSSLTSVIISNSVTSIKFGTFSFCSSLTSITIPNSVTSIDYGAFNQCSSLTSITIPNSVTSIGESAFGFCFSLTSITIPNSVTSIGNYAFNNCNNLSSVYCYISNPLVINQNVFNEVNQGTCSLIVPTNSINAYQAAPVWQNFYQISVLNINNFSIKDNIQLYPNPVKNELFINTKNLTDIKLEILDINGKLLLNQKINLTNTIDTSNLSNGMYLFKITSNEGSIIEKIIKN